MKLHFDIKLFLSLSFGFILFTIVGTLSHEYGHYLAGRIMGVESEVHYAYTHVINGRQITPLAYRVFCYGGPMQTMLTGTIGFMFLLLNYNKYRLAETLQPKQWILVLLSLFWLRQVFNYLGELYFYYMLGEVNSNNDEVNIARYFNLAPLSISMFTGVLASIILAIVFFLFIPRKQKLTFLISGLCGGLLGFYIWMDVLGPRWMP